MLLNALLIYLSFFIWIPELSYLIKLKLNSDVLTKCLTFYILFYIFILCYNFFINIPIGHISVMIFMGVIKRV